MKNATRILCCLLAVFLLMTGCMAESTTDKKIANGDVTLTIYIEMRSGASQAYASYAEHPLKVGRCGVRRHEKHESLGSLGDQVLAEHESE